MRRLCFMLAVVVLMFGSGSAFAQDGPPATWTFSIWHWLIVLVALTVRVLGMWALRGRAAANVCFPVARVLKEGWAH